MLDDPAWPEDKLKTKIATITEERKRIQAELEQVEHSLDAGRELLRKALELLSNPQELFRQAEKAERRVLTLTIFGKLFVQTREIVGHELNEPFDMLSAAELSRRTPDGEEKPHGRAYGRALALPGGWDGADGLAALRAFQGDPGGTFEDASWADLSSVDLLTWDLRVAGSPKGLMVGDRGLEPPTSASQTRRASQLRQSPNCPIITD